VTNPLHEESPTLLVREIVVKPVPFITVAVRQEFELRDCGVDGGLRLCRAEYIKQRGLVPRLVPRTSQRRR